MASYSIEWKTSAAKELRKLPKPIIARILPAIESLCEDPRPAGVVKITNSVNTYRIRVGEYRIVYNIFDRQLVIEVIRIQDRKDVYK